MKSRPMLLLLLVLAGCSGGTKKPVSKGPKTAAELAASLQQLIQAIDWTNANIARAKEKHTGEPAKWRQEAKKAFVELEETFAKHDQERIGGMVRETGVSLLEGTMVDEIPSELEYVAAKIPSTLNNIRSALEDGRQKINSMKDKADAAELAGIQTALDEMNPWQEPTITAFEPSPVELRWDGPDKRSYTVTNPATAIEGPARMVVAGWGFDKKPKPPFSVEVIGSDPDKPRKFPSNRFTIRTNRQAELNIGAPARGGGIPFLGPQKAPVPRKREGPQEFQEGDRYVVVVWGEGPLHRRYCPIVWHPPAAER